MESALFRSLVTAAADRESATARWLSVSFVVAAARLLLGGGLLLLERAARRGNRRRRLEEEFITTLQGADEAEAQDLLRRHVERALPGSAAVALSRDASNRQLLPATDADVVAGLGERLDGAAPRDCLAVRRGSGTSAGPPGSRCSRARSAATSPARRAAPRRSSAARSSARCW